MVLPSDLFSTFEEELVEKNPRLLDFDHSEDSQEWYAGWPNFQKTKKKKKGATKQHWVVLYTMHLHGLKEYKEKCTCRDDRPVGR
jgi:hypothetical protein